MLARIHDAIERSGRDTWEAERAATLLLEIVLLAACAVPSVVGWRSAACAVVVALLRLYEAEVRREDASVTGRHREAGGVSPLPPHKAARAAVRARRLEVITWLWPALIAMALAVDAGRFASTAVLALVATLARAAWSRVVLPRWRASRLAWRAARKEAVKAGLPEVPDRVVSVRRVC